MPSGQLTDSEQRPADAVVSIVARRLDSEEREESTVEVTRPVTEADLKARLIDLVGARYPAAELRSFADGAASFLAPKVLVVAAIEELRGAGRGETDGATPGDPADDERPAPPQQQLFAA